MFMFETPVENSMHWAGHTHGLSCIALCFGLSEALSTMLDLFTTLRTSRFVHISLPICIHTHGVDGHTYPMTGHVLYITLHFLYFIFSQMHDLLNWSLS